MGYVEAVFFEIDVIENITARAKTRKELQLNVTPCSKWAHTDLNCGPSDYESDALTN